MTFSVEYYAQFLEIEHHYDTEGSDDIINTQDPGGQKAKLQD